ncbi:hypothetical protein PRtIB026_A44960 [Pseudomonas sp. RtIB026]|nr:hypothetical protein PRtIB026_A44960 [Pseudomonas sp. RtIB026]
MCRERAAKQPQVFSVKAEIAGSAARPFRGTRPLLQGGARRDGYLNFGPERVFKPLAMRSYSTTFTVAARFMQPSVGM